MLDQPQTDHRRRNARVERDPFGQLGLGRKNGAAQHRVTAIGIVKAQFLIGDLHLAFGGHACDRLILKLMTKGRIGGTIRITQREKHRHHVGIARFGWMPAAILDMAALTGARIEQRPQAVRPDGRGRRRNPRPVEHAVANKEIRALLECQRGGRQGKGVAVKAVAVGAGPALQRLKGFRAAEIGGRCQQTGLSVCLGFRPAGGGCKDHE